MKILKQGKIPDRDRIKKCNFCKCKFVYNTKDKFYETSDGTDTFDVVQCPTCETIMSTSVFDKKYFDKTKERRV